MASSVAKQAQFGGVVPEVAAREHLNALGPLWETLQKQSGVRASDIDGVAVTRGPGLIGALLVGVSFAKSFAAAARVPLIPVDHVHAHMHGAFLGIEEEGSSLFPLIGAVISGGHSNLYLMRDFVTFEKLASTIDDACGECFDKVGKILGTPYPGGPEIEKLAARAKDHSIEMPKMVKEKSRLEFSYSGLKTHVLNTWRKMSGPLSPGSAEYSKLRENISYAFQEQAFDLILRKLKLTLKEHPDVKSVVIAGGVAANQRFREILSGGLKPKVYYPKLAYCSDNAAMIAALGYHLYETSTDKSDFDIMDWDPYSRQT